MNGRLVITPHILLLWSTYATLLLGREWRRNPCLRRRAVVCENPLSGLGLRSIKPVG